MCIHSFPSPPTSCPMESITSDGALQRALTSRTVTPSQLSFDSFESQTNTCRTLYSAIFFSLAAQPAVEWTCFPVSSPASTTSSLPLPSRVSAAAVAVRFPAELLPGGCHTGKCEDCQWHADTDTPQTVRPPSTAAGRTEGGRALRERREGETWREGRRKGREGVMGGRE